jgi:hypothetical protein
MIERRWQAARDGGCEIVVTETDFDTQSQHNKHGAIGNADCIHEGQLGGRAAVRAGPPDRPIVTASSSAEHPMASSHERSSGSRARMWTLIK